MTKSIALRLFAVSFLICSAAAICAAATGGPLLLREPSISKTQIAFSYGGDIWIVNREGGTAQRLVTGYDLETGPIFSPDGSMVAFSGNYDGNVDVYVVPTTGGEPKRLTYHPDPDVAVGWTPDGKNILFVSNRASTNDPAKLFTIPVTGGFPTELPLSMATDGSFSPDATHIAYVPTFRWEPFWKGYRGGQTTPVWIANLVDSSVEKVPRDNSNDSNPMWVGRTVYFLSDRNGPVTLFAYDPQTQKVTQAIANHGFDITDASAGDGTIVYSQFGELHVYDPASHLDRAIHVTVAADMPQVRPHWEKVGDDVLNADISPAGQRAVFEAHGDIFTVPAEKGDVRNITSSPGVANRDPAWSPDGRWIAFFSDESGEYELHLKDQKGLEPARVISLGNHGFYYSPTWSPDSKEIAYTDKFLELWYVDIDHPTPVKVDTDEDGGGGFNAKWSPDGRWLTYTKGLPNLLSAVFVYSLDTTKATQITDGMSDCLSPNFDRSGKYIYFAASTNRGLGASGFDMSGDLHPTSSSVYVAVLRKDLPSPIPPESDDEKAADASTAKSEQGAGAAANAKKSEELQTPKIEIDFDGILQRILSLPIPEANYVSLDAGKEGELFLAAVPEAEAGFGPPILTVSKFDLKTRKVTPAVAGVFSFALSADGEKMLYRQGRSWFINSTAAPAEPGKGMIDTSGMETYVVPRLEWAQMYHETWRIERDFFYDPHYHGLNLDAAEKEFVVYLPGIASRDDLTFLFEEMLSYLSVGHMFVRGGHEPEMPHVNVGLLGADYRIASGRYQFAKIYSGENWNPELHAPLTEPGVNVQAGEYLLAVNGRELTASDDVYSFFQETAGKQTVLRVGPNPSDSGSREVTVVPVPTEFPLRNLDWIEDNRRLVDRLSGGKLAYVYLPDTEAEGYTNFNRYFFSQVGKEGVILDERFNHGGQLADYIVDALVRQPLAIEKERSGNPRLDPQMAIFGPKVMIINQFAGSGGDALPWMFRKQHAGTLVGERTWGGLVGIGGYPVLLDGGLVTAPRFAIGGLSGQWEVEGHGIAPDVEVWQDPKLIREGHDPQLEKAVAIALEQLKEHPLPHYEMPPYTDHHPVLPPVPHE
jgi:tricorn protease